MSDTSKRIRKLIDRHPEMTDEQIARKIGRPDEGGALRVACERPQHAYDKAQETRLDPYSYRGWTVHHYVLGGEQFIACQEERQVRATTKEEIERAVDGQIPPEGE